MTIRAFIDFLDDERGSYTIWSLVWFIMYVLIGGVAVDGTDAYRIKTELQSTADAAALAGLLSLGTSGQDPVQVAVDYAEANMPPGLNGTVVKPSEVYIGTWDFETRHFTDGGANPNAVYVVARRDAENLNAVEMSFLRIAQIWGFGTWWNINTVAIAAEGFDYCNNNGIIAREKIEIKTWTHFKNNICLIGNDGIWHRDNKNIFETGVHAGVTCTMSDNKKCIGPTLDLAMKSGGENTFSEAFKYQENSDGTYSGNFMDTTKPLNAMNLHKYVNAISLMGTPGYTTYNDWLTEVETNSDYDGIAWSYTWDGQKIYTYDYLANLPGLSGVLTEQGSDGSLATLPASALAKLVADPPEEQYTVYHISCAGGSLDLPSGVYLNMAIMADCPINLHNDYEMMNVVISTTFKGEIGIHANGNLSLGPKPDANNCESIGGVELWALGSDVRFAAGGHVSRTRILSTEDVHFAAQADGEMDIHIEALGQVFLASGSANKSTFGLCPNAPPNGAQALTHALVF